LIDSKEGGMPTSTVVNNKKIYMDKQKRAKTEQVKKPSAILFAHDQPHDLLPSRHAHN
jgi:hypothetical protein